MFARLWDGICYFCKRVADALIIFFALVLLGIWQMARACTDSSSEILVIGSDKMFIAYNCTMGVF